MGLFKRNRSTETTEDTGPDVALLGNPDHFNQHAEDYLWMDTGNKVFSGPDVLALATSLAVEWQEIFARYDVDEQTPTDDIINSAALTLWLNKFASSESHIEKPAAFSIGIALGFAIAGKAAARIMEAAIADSENEAEEAT